MADLKRQLGLLDSTMINVGTIIASAIFIVPSVIALNLGASLPTILVWVVGGAVSVLGALSAAELGAAMPNAGGIYVYLSRAYGPLWGYLYGWSSGVVINPASIAAIALGFATYVGFFFPLGDGGTRAVAVASIAGLTVLNSLGVRLGAVTQNVLTLTKIGLVIVLIVVGFVLPGGSVANLAPLWSDAPLGKQIASFGVARVPYAMARDGLLPRWLATVHPRFLTPIPSLAVQAVVAIALTLISTDPSWKNTYNHLFTYVVLAEFVFYGMSCGAVIVLRRKEPGLVRPYKAWGYPVTPIVFILFALWLLYNTAREQPVDVAMSTLLILAGLPLYWWQRRLATRVAAAP